MQQLLKQLAKLYTTQKCHIAFLHAAVEVAALNNMVFHVNRDHKCYVTPTRSLGEIENIFHSLFATVNE